MWIRRGLVDAASKDIFDTALKSLKTKWNLLEKDIISENTTVFILCFHHTGPLSFRSNFHIG